MIDHIEPFLLISINCFVIIMAFRIKEYSQKN